MVGQIVRAAAVIALLAAIIAPLRPASLAQAQAVQTRGDNEPHVYMNVVATNESLRLWGVNTRLLIVPDAVAPDAAPHIRVEGRNAAGDRFVTFSPEYLRRVNGDVNCYAEGDDADFPCSNWRVRFPAVGVNNRVMATDFRFGNDEGQWSQWFTITENGKLEAATTGPNLYEAIRNLGLTIGRYDPYPEAPVAPGAQTETQGAPTEYITDRLKSLPGGELTAIFLIPMIATGFALMATRSPALLLLIVAGTMAAAIFLVEASPFALIMPAVLGLGGALVGVQFGYTRQFGGDK